jgi:hypothetical protein
MQFEELLERLGGEFAEREDNSDKNSHRKITLHSLRRYVYSTVSDLGYNQFVDKYMLGHSYDVSTYYRKPEKERIEIFRRIEPYLTYLNVTAALEKKGADMATEIEALKEELRQQKKTIYKEIGKRFADAYKKYQDMGRIKK